MRKGFEGLYGLVRDRLSCEPLSGHLFLFCNAQRNRLKVLVWDGSGLWVCAKRLEKGRFTWPQSGDAQGKVVLSHEELSLLLGGATDLSKRLVEHFHLVARQLRQCLGNERPLDLPSGNLVGFELRLADKFRGQHSIHETVA